MQVSLTPSSLCARFALASRSLRSIRSQTNILPQAALMNRGAWLKTEMMVECWRNEAPTTVIGGAVYMGDGLHGQAMPAEWKGFDRSEWFIDSHKVKNPTYFWKIIITGAVEEKGMPLDYIAFWCVRAASTSTSKLYQQ